MARSTSASVAMLVSPGVVMASAPWATPQATACSRTFTCEKSIQKPRGEAVAAAYAVVDLDFALGDVDDFWSSYKAIAPQLLTVAVVAVRRVLAMSLRLGYEAGYFREASLRRRGRGARRNLR